MIEDEKLIRGTIADLEARIKDLEQQRVGLDQRIEETRQRLQSWKRMLSDQAATGSSNPPRRRRARKGQNLATVLAFFMKLPDGKAVGITEIAEKTGIPWGSVRNVLQRSAKFREEGGVWYLRDREEDATTQHQQRP